MNNPSNPNGSSNPFGEGGIPTDAALDQWIADAEAKAAQYQKLSASVAEVSVTEGTPDGLLTVTVNASGQVTDLRISERATELAGPQLAGAILGVMRRAQARIAGRVAELMRDTVGQDTALAEAVLSGYRDQFPAPPEPSGPLRAPAPPRAPAAQRPQPPMRPPAPVPNPPPVQAPRPMRAPRRADDDWTDSSDSVLEGID